jgi:hypothetical protein
VQANSVTIAYQGYAGSNTLETIDFTKWGKDPKDGQYFSYYLTADRKYFQLMAFLEEEANITTQLNISDSVQAVDYSNRIPTVYGKRLWILTNIDNVPIQEVITTELDILVDDVTTYVAHLNDDEKILWSEGGLTLLRKAPLSNFDYGESLVGYWDMESIYSTDMLADMSGNGTHLGNQNSVTIWDNVDGAFISTGFNWVNQGFEKASWISSKLDLATDFSFSAWFFPESLASGWAYWLQNLIFTKGSLATVNYAIQITSQNSITFIERGLSQSLQHSVFSGLADMINKWTHIVVSINDGEIYLYMNWEFIEKKNIGAIEYQSNDPINIWWRGGVETFFDGYIDEVKVFNKALDISGVERLYEER